MNLHEVFCKVDDGFNISVKGRSVIIVSCLPTEFAWQALVTYFIIRMDNSP